MQSHPEETFRMVKKEADSCTDSCYTGHLQSTLQEPIEVSSSNKDNSHDIGDIDDQSIEDSSKQLVLYDPVANGAGQIEHVPQPIQYQHPFGRYSDPNVPSRVLPSVGAFTIQCAKCFKWRLIPTKKKYEELREHILEEPFFCETARAWRPDISCDDPTDITQDGSRLWAIDKPNIAQPPPGWQRLLRIRGEGSTKFADVYYQSPSGKRLRSMVEVQKYLTEHPEYMTYGVTLSQFSFQIPKPLQENYVRKRRPHISASIDDTRHLQLSEGWIDSAFRSSGVFVVLQYENCLKWIGDFTELQLGNPALLPPPSSIESSASPPFDGPVKKKARTQSKKSHRTANPVFDQDEARVEELDQSGNSGSDL
ncbi:METHYL-CPG BINDING PROTEIN MBD [Salix viminalis]|uniref:METHYL-CPG BINDING PROTEIN MBD n=1 Tax=Salix viminalis TaxID=40686 RepID=A0A9Q0V4N5_SALVM|nr:METHYL-CPG BINDING PROTEIN MBD [Salix viminalis]